MNNNKDIEEVNNDINGIDESIYNNESNDDLNDEVVCDSENKEKYINDIYEKLLQYKVTDHYLHKYHVKGTSFIILHDI